MLMSEELKGCVTWFIYFLDLFWLSYNCAKFHHYRICMTDFREGGLFFPPIREQPRKSPSWIRLTLSTDWWKISSLYVVSVPNYWTLTKSISQKKWFFWSNLYKIEVMITSVIQMQQLPNFGHMTTSMLWFYSCDRVLLVTS